MTSEKFYTANNQSNFSNIRNEFEKILSLIGQDVHDQIDILLILKNPSRDC